MPRTTDQPVDQRAAALAGLAASSDVAYATEPLTSVELTAAAEAGITVMPGDPPADIRRMTAEAGTGIPRESVVPAGDLRTAEEYDPGEAPSDEQLDRATVARDAALAELTAAVDESARITVPLTGRTVDYGGDLERIVVSSRYNGMVEGKPEVGPQLAMAGDLVKVTEAEAERGEQLGALVEVPGDVDPEDPDGAEIVVEDAGAAWSDEELEGAGARELIQYVNEHPDQLDRVLEAERARDKPRSSVLGLDSRS